MQEMEQLYRKYAKTVYKYALCLTKKEQLAEELTQETFAQAVERIATFRGDCKVSVWLCQIAKYIWYKEQKKNKSLQFAENMEELKMVTTDIAEEIFYTQEKIALFKKIQELEEPMKSVMYLRLTGELTFEEIGEVLGKTANWARVVFHRGKQKIKEVKSDEKGM